MVAAAREAAEEQARRQKTGGTSKSAPASTRSAGSPADPDLQALERQLGDMLGLSVQVAHKGHGGTVTLRYSSLDQLDMICQRLSGEPI